MAFVSVLRGKRLTYKVTPKGDHGYMGSSSLSIFIPHLTFGFIAVLGLLSSFFTHRQSTDMMIWATSTAILMLIVPFTQYLHHYYVKVRTFIKKHLIHILGTSEHTIYKLPEGRKPSNSLISTVIDCIFLAFAVLLSFTGYVDRLGFYSDDWSFLGNFTLSADKSLSGSR